METSSNGSNSSIPYKHVLQTTGLLKAFGVAKIVRESELRELKRLLKSVTTTKEEYDAMLQEEIEKLSQMGDVKNPIPGMVLILGSKARSVAVIGGAKAYAKKLKQLGWTREVMCIYILSLIKELGLNQSDFDGVISPPDEDLHDEDDDDEDDDE